jgi:hypothetical protein
MSPQRGCHPPVLLGLGPNSRELSIHAYVRHPSGWRSMTLPGDDNMWTTASCSTRHVPRCYLSKCNSACPLSVTRPSSGKPPLESNCGTQPPKFDATRDTCLAHRPIADVPPLSSIGLQCSPGRRLTNKYWHPFIVHSFQRHSQVGLTVSPFFIPVNVTPEVSE